MISLMRDSENMNESDEIFSLFLDISSSVLNFHEKFVIFCVRLDFRNFFNRAKALDMNG